MDDTGTFRVLIHVELCTEVGSYDPDLDTRLRLKPINEGLNVRDCVGLEFDGNGSSDFRKVCVYDQPVLFAVD